LFSSDVFTPILIALLPRYRPFTCLLFNLIVLLLACTLQSYQLLDYLGSIQRFHHHARTPLLLISYHPVLLQLILSFLARSFKVSLLVAYFHQTFMVYVIIISFIHFIITSMRFFKPYQTKCRFQEDQLLIKFNLLTIDFLHFVHFYAIDFTS